MELLKIEDKKLEITCIDSILDKILEEDLKILCLKYIEQHNSSYYEELEKEYHYKSENSITKYISYFNEIGIDFTTYPEEEQQEIMTNSLEELKEKIKLLSVIFEEKKDCLSISKKAELSTIKEINDMLKKGYTTVELLLNNRNLYYDSHAFNNLKQNIQVLSQENINLIRIEDKKFLLADHQLLLENINTLKKSSIDISLLKDLKLLSDENLLEKINSFIEVGLEEIIKRKPDVLNADINLAKRIIITELVGDEVFEQEGIKSLVLNKDEFFVSDGYINNYLLDRDNSNYNNKNVIELTTAKETQMSYLLENIIIPKGRVNNLCISLESLIRPSLYSKEEVKVLEKYQKVEK